MLKTLAPILLILCVGTSSASAIGFMTQLNCANDYYAYCSEFTVGSKELRVCMRRAGPKLSKACLDALIADGEVSKDEVAKRKDEIVAAKSQKKQKSTVEQKVVETPQRQDRIVLDEPTFVALKKREPRFIEEAEAVEASKYADEPRALDPEKRDLKVVADPVDAEAPKFLGEAKSEEPRDQERTVIDKSNNVDKYRVAKEQRSLGHPKSKTKVAAHKAERQRGAKEESRHKAQTASQ
jgi:hypothetical protein